MKVKKSITELARDLRKRQTPAEKVLWGILRNRKLNGYKFTRQHPIVYYQDRYSYNFFIADFYSAEHNLVIELDGDLHKHQKFYDEQKDLILNKKGLKVLRLKNEEIRNREDLKRRILEMIELNK